MTTPLAMAICFAAAVVFPIVLKCIIEPDGGRAWLRNLFQRRVR